MINKLSTLPYRNNDGVGDSDSEDGSNYNPSYFSRSESIHANQTTVATSNTNIKGNQLIKITHDRVHELHKVFINKYKKNYADCVHKRNGILFEAYSNTNDKNFVKIANNKDWMLALGACNYWGVNNFEKPPIFSKDDLYQNVEIEISSQIFYYKQIVTDQGSGARLFFDENKDSDFSYTDINSRFDRFLKNLNIPEIKVAKIQLYLIQNPNADFEQVAKFIEFGLSDKKNEKEFCELIKFLNWLNFLMLIVESSSANAGLAISLMTIELISSGQLKYKEAFYANNDGGSYPYATFSNDEGNNIGTFQTRAEIIKDNNLIGLNDEKNKKSIQKIEERIKDLEIKKAKNEADEPKIEHILKKLKKDALALYEAQSKIHLARQFPELSPVAVKEAMLIKRWLTLKSAIHSDQTMDQNIASINTKIQSLLAEYFGD